MNYLRSTLVLAICFIFFSSCEDNRCPEGSLPIEDANGNVIDCFTPPDFGEVNEDAESI